MKSDHKYGGEKMNFEKEYREKLVTAEQAATAIKSDDWVDYGWCVTTPDAVDKALAKRITEVNLTNVKFRGGILMREPEIFKIENAADHFVWNSWHMGGIERRAVAKGFCFYAPLRYSELPRYYLDMKDPVDVAIFVCSPMDEHGYFNFGPSASHLGAVMQRAKKIIVEVNNTVPRCLGGVENGVHIDRVDMIVESDNTQIPVTGAAGEPSEVDQKVAELIVNEIPNGACLQLGIGGMPNAVGKLIAESDLKNLGVHTEMYVDSFVDIARAGKINGSQKNIDRFRQTYAFGSGTKKMYDYLNDNPECMSTSVGYTNDVRVISQLDNFMSINNAVDIDLYGQISSESSGTKHISGAGGQLDFVLGAYLSQGGKSFICLSSTFTDKKGEMHSRILPTLHDGSVVTDTRANVQYIVTEYGIINLKGLATWQRAEALISIAHPDMRDQLIKDAEKMGIWRRTNKE